MSAISSFISFMPLMKFSTSAFLSFKSLVFIILPHVVLKFVMVMVMVMMMGSDSDGDGDGEGGSDSDKCKIRGVRRRQ